MAGFDVIRRPKYLGTASKGVEKGSLKSRVLLDGWQLKETVAHTLVLGSVNLQFALDVREQLHKWFGKARPGLATNEEVAHAALLFLKLPRRLEYDFLRPELSQLRLRFPEAWGAQEKLKTEVARAFKFSQPLDFSYELAVEKTAFNPSGLEWHNRQVKVLSLDEDGFKASHHRGVRRYSWHKVREATMLDGDANKIEPQLAIQLDVYKLQLRSRDLPSVMHIRIKEVGSSRELIPVTPQRRHPREKLIKQWG